MELKPGHHYSALTSCDVFGDKKESQVIICEGGRGEQTVSVGGRLVYFTEIEEGTGIDEGKLKHYIVVPDVPAEKADAWRESGVIPESDEKARETREGHYATIEWLAKGGAGAKEYQKKDQ